MKWKGSLTHRLPLFEVDLPVVVLVRFVDQFQKVSHNRFFKLSDCQQGETTGAP